jgi:hypothetical protein
MPNEPCPTISAKELRQAFNKILNARAHELSARLDNFKIFLGHCRGHLDVNVAEISRSGNGINGCSCIERKNRRNR